jgi:hypothetical protein
MVCAMLTKFHYITNLKKWLQVGFRTFYRASESSPFSRSPWSNVLGRRFLAFCGNTFGQHLAYYTLTGNPSMY